MCPHILQSQPVGRVVRGLVCFVSSIDQPLIQLGHDEKQPITTKKLKAPGKLSSTSESEASAPRRHLRPSTESFPISHPASPIGAANLPTIRKILKVYLHQQHNDKCPNERAAITRTEEYAKTFWTMVRVSTITEINCKAKLRGSIKA